MINRITLTLVLVLLFLACSRQPESFEVREGFTLELVAAEPQTTDPIAVAFDERGRMYVVEMTGYPEGTSPPRGKVRILEDADGDDEFETSHVFLDGLEYPTSVLPWNGGVLVGNPPDIVFCKDTNGDNRADVRQVLFTGFDVGNTQHNFNSLVWGLDNWVYGASGGNAGTVSSAAEAGEPISIRRKDFRFRPDTGEFEITATTGGGYGYTFDEWGHAFTTHNLYHAQHVVMPERYLLRNPGLGVSSTLQEISDHERVSRLFPISVPETRFNHPEQSGYFSGSSGITYYGGAFPAPFNGSLFVGDVVTNVVHRDVIEQTGATFRASRSEENSEFLASRDNWFRPVSLAVGPEGALYVIDMHRAVIEHPEWIPDPIEKKLDVRAGDDKGRIYRVLPREGLPKRRINLANASIEYLMHTLDDPNIWQRQTAQRLLIERKNRAATGMLTGFLSASQSAQGRLHAMWTLHGLNALSDEQVLKLLNDPEAGVRENALKIAETRARRNSEIGQKLRALAQDPDPRVRFQVALSLGEIRDESEDALYAIAVRDLEDQWTRLAVVSSIGDEDFEFLKGFLVGQTDKNYNFRVRPQNFSEGRLAMIRLLSSSIGARANEEHLISTFQSLIASDLNDALVIASLEGLAEGLSRAPADRAFSSRPASLVERILQKASASLLRAAWPVADRMGVRNSAIQRQALERAALRAVDNTLPLDDRLAEIQLLEFSDYAAHRQTVLPLASPGEPSAIQEAAVTVVGKWGEKSGVQDLLDGWRRLSPGARRNLVSLVLRNIDFHMLLVERLEQEKIRFGELALNLEQRRRLLWRSSEEVKARAAKLFGDEEYSNRNQVVNQYMDVLKLQGDPEKGQGLFGDACAKCHAIRGNGAGIGPDLSHIYTKSAETLLTEILDPNAIVEDRYISYNIVKKSGAYASGIIKDETTTTITLTAGASEEETVNRNDIASMTASGISLMPEGLEQGLDRQKLADLLAFLQQRPPTNQPNPPWWKFW